MTTLAPGARISPNIHWILVLALLGLAATLGIVSLLDDSVTFDETSHLTAGMSYLLAGDFRMAPDHPPLAKIWCALPLLFVPQQWPAPDEPGWRNADVYTVGARWLFELNDGQRLVVIARLMMVVLLLATCLTTYALGRTLFGPTAGLLALAIAAVSPELLAHGRLVTTDVPITLCSALTLLAFARLLQAQTWARLLAAMAALAAASVTKMSWPLVVPALAAMLAWQLWTNKQRATTLGSVALIGLTTWLAIWTCYGWRYSLTPSPAGPPVVLAAGVPPDALPGRLPIEWYQGVYDLQTGRPAAGVLPTLLRAVRGNHILPEAYVVGLAMTLSTTSERPAYLLGRYSQLGWWYYFPVAFLIKTPVATIALLVAGIVALVRRRVVAADRALFIGVLSFVAIYGLYVVTSNLNIGHRHLLPVYPIFYVVAGAAAAWLSSRVGRVLIGASLVWLIGASLWAFPNYLAYFNELIGGPARGHLYLADSNIDWGQDLVRLARYAREHPGEQIKLAYFGSAQPTYYLDCAALPSMYAFSPPAELTAGTYVTALTQLLGVYDPEIRDDFWDARHREAYRILGELAVEPAQPDESAEQAARRATARQEFSDLRAKRLLNRLRHRPPEQRIGSLWLHHLTEADVADLTAP